MDGVIPVVPKLNNTEWRLARKRAIASLDPICVLCDKYIDVQLPRKNPETGAWNDLAVEVDHKVPRSRGGALYDIDNLQLSHSVCNRKKGARMAEDYGTQEEYQNPVPLSNAW